MFLLNTKKNFDRYCGTAKLIGDLIVKILHIFLVFWPDGTKSYHLKKNIFIKCNQSWEVTNHKRKTKILNCEWLFLSTICLPSLFLHLVWPPTTVWISHQHLNGGKKIFSANINLSIKSNIQCLIHEIKYTRKRTSHICIHS